MKDKVIKRTLRLFLLIAALWVTLCSTAFAAEYATYTGIDYASIVKANDLDSKRITVLDKAKKMTTVLWTCRTSFPTWISSQGVPNPVTAYGESSSTTSFIAGKRYQGIPYTMNTVCGGLAATNRYDDVSWSNYAANGSVFSCIENYYGKNTTAAVGIDCSAFVQRAFEAAGFNVGTVTTANAKSTLKLSEISKNRLMPGDILLKSGHIMLCAGYTSSGNIAIFEATPAKSQYTTYSLSGLSSYTAYRSAFFSEIDPVPNPDPGSFDEALSDPIIFNAEYYTANRPDVTGSDQDKLNHWIAYGVYEGATASHVFSVEYYLANNPDIRDAYGDSNNPAVVEHFLAFGVSEGRITHPDFYIDYYKANYADLQTVFGDDNYQYYLHYINSGRHEGRIGKERIKAIFNANGGSVSPASKEITHGELYGDLPTPTRAGYTFDGWYTAASGGTKVTAGVQYIGKNSITLYAHWTAKSMTASFNANGGSVSTSSKSVTYGKTYGDLPTPTRTGYTFAGWQDSNGAVITSSTKVSKTSNHTLTAQWTAKTMTVSFDSNGGSSVSSITATYDKPYGTLPTPTRTGYTFAGWQDADGNAITSATKVIKTSNHTLTAQWTQNSVIVTFNANGGSVSPASQTANIGSTYGTLPIPARTGYTFAGWQDADGNVITSATTVISTADHTLTAQWTANTMTVSFDSNGGSSVSSITATYDKIYGTLPIPARTGYTFAGWQDADGNAITSATTVIRTADHTLTAQWTKNTVALTSIQLNLLSVNIFERDTIQLTATLVPADVTDRAVVWASLNESIASVDANGLVTGISEGMSIITVTHTATGKEAACVVYVKAAKALVLPAMLTEIEAEAFSGNTSISVVKAAPGLKRINSAAFKACSSLTDVWLPDTVSFIASDAFDGCSDKLTFHCPANSIAYYVAKANGFEVKTDYVAP